MVAGPVKPDCTASIRRSSMNLLGAAAVVLVLLTSALSTSAAQSRGEIRVWTARAIATVLAEIGPEFERATGYRLTVTSDFASSVPASRPRRRTVRRHHQWLGHHR